jgi:hypothetical protein
MARVRADDAATLHVLTDLSSSPIGRPGAVARGADDLLSWRMTSLQRSEYSSG